MAQAEPSYVFMYRQRQGQRHNDDLPQNLHTKITYHVVMRCTQIGFWGILVPELLNRKKKDNAKTEFRKGKKWQ